MDNIEQTQPSLRYLEPLLLMRNVNGRFTDVSNSSGAPFRMPVAARGLAIGDLDNDGFLDAVVNCLDGSPVILRNQGNANHWLTLELQGTRSNRDAAGARVEITGASGVRQWATASTAGSYQSAGDKRIHFGLGADRRVSVIKLTWPDGQAQTLENVRADQILKVIEPTER
jgi:hypothetical protein